MPIIEKHFWNEGMDGDTNQRLLSDKAMLNCMNARMAVSEQGRNLRLENVPGTTLIPNLVRPPYGVDQTIGTAVDEDSGRIIYFNYNTFGDHGIYCYDPSLNQIFALIYDSQVIGGLGFSLDSLIHSARVENGVVYWADSTNNEPRKLNINAAIKMNDPSQFVVFTTGQELFTSSSIIFDATSVIKAPLIHYSAFVVGDIINVSGSASNDGYYAIISKTIILGDVWVTVSPPSIINEAAGASVTISEASEDGVDPYTYSMEQSTLRWIRRQPGLQLSSEKKTNSAYNNNFIKNEAFQFCWRYIYREYEQSTLSGLSPLQNYNQAADTFNYITATAPLGEFIEQDVIQVDFVVKYLNSGKYFIFKSWNKNVSADFDALWNHDYGGIPLSVDFYNDILGIALDDAYSVKPFDSVPIYAQTIEMARFRSFMFNYTIGYNTPLVTSLTAAAQTSDSATLTGRWVKIVYAFGASTHYYIDLGSLGFFDTGYQPPPFLATEAYADMTLVASGPSSFATYILSIHPTGWIGGIQYTGDSSEITGGPPVPGVSGQTAFKSGASYQVSIHFLDHSGRKCGIVTTTDLKINSGEREYDQIEYTTGINWSLSNTNKFNEIPVWAYYYSINITKCLTTRYFQQARVKNITYATKDLATGLYLFNTTAYATTLNGVGIDITSLNSFGQGYVFSEGDLVKVYISGDPTIYNLSVVAQQDNWIVCELKNLGVLGNTAGTKTDVLFELYTPYRPSTSEPNYEYAIYKVTNPTESTREYSTLAGTITGDITILTRNDGSDYLTENMSPNDKFFGQWNTSTGRPNFIDTIGQVVKTNTIAYSNVIIQGTKTNGLSTYDALDTKDISLECGDGVKLQVANKISDEQGTIMLALCKFQTASCYLGEVQLVGQERNAFVAQAADVIGTINILQGSFGTVHPESVNEYLGLVFFFDLYNGSYIQYSNNGLEQVSRYKQSRFFKNYAKNYLVTSSTDIDTINGFHHIRSMVDPFTKEALVTLPALIVEADAEELPSYTSVPSYATSIINRFDISDSLGKTMSFQFEQNKWGSNYEWLAEWSEQLQNQLYMFKNGNIYKANSDTINWNTVFDVTYPVRVCFTANMNPSLLKDLATIAVEASAIPNYVVAMANTPNEQITDLASTDDVWRDQQGIFYASFLRDRLSPNATGTADEKLFKGDELTDVALFIMCEWQQNTNLFYINFVNIGWQGSRGQKAISDPANK